MAHARMAGVGIKRPPQSIGAAADDDSIGITFSFNHVELQETQVRLCALGVYPCRYLIISIMRMSWVRMNLSQILIYSLENF